MRLVSALWARAVLDAARAAGEELPYPPEEMLRQLRRGVIWARLVSPSGRWWQGRQPGALPFDGRPEIVLAPERHAEEAEAACGDARVFAVAEQ